MPDNIAGYIDRSYVKGSTYRYAGCPIPTVFTGNINVVSEDLLVKAMVAVSGTAQGDFPGTVADRFLIQTIKYGNDVYLQTAVTSDGSEYRRIYTEGSGWTDWNSVSKEFDAVDGRLDELESYKKTSSADIEKHTNELYGYGNTPGLTTRVEVIEKQGYGTKITSLNDKINNKIQQVTINQNVSMRTAGEVNGYFQLSTELNYPKNGILIGMAVNTSQIGKIAGTVYMLSYSANGTKPYINYQKGSGVTFSNVPHDFIFTFYVP